MPIMTASVITTPLLSAGTGSRQANPPATFADLAAHIKGDVSLSPTGRRDKLSGLSGMARVLGRELKDVPAHAGFIREQLKGFHPSTLTPPMSVARWRNIQSIVNTALKQAGIAISSGRYQAPVSPAWLALLAKLTSKRRFELSRLGQFCTANGLAPEAVDDEVLARLLVYLNQTLANKSPREIHRTACKAWNIAGETVEGWPPQKLKVPDYRRRYAVPLDRFDPAFIANMDGYLACLGPKDILSDDGGDFRPLRPISIKSHALQLHEFASAVVLRGRDPKTLTSLADLLEIETFKEGLRFFYEERTPGKYLQAYRMAVILLPVGKYWVNLPAEQLKTLQAICRRLDTKPKGMTEKNRKLLAPFDDAAVVEAFLGMSTLMMADVNRAEQDVAKKRCPRPSRHTGRGLHTPHQRALLVQTAAAIETITMAPLRIANLGRIQIGTHLVPHGETYRLQFEEHEVKNEQRLGPVLPKESAKNVRTYIERYRKHLTNGPAPFLFPGTKGPHKHLQVLAGQIKRAAKEYAGITLTPHTFRHIAAKLHLAAHPGDFETVREFLGHKDIQTTISIYCEFQQPAAFKRYDEHVLKLRERGRDRTLGDAKPTRKGH